MSLSLDTDVRYLSGIGERRAQLFDKLDIRTVGDLLRHFPRSYEDRTVIRPIAELRPGDSCSVVGVVVPPLREYRVPGGMTVLKLRISDGHGRMNVTFFNNRYVASRLKPGEEYLFYGKTGGEPLSPELINPVFSPTNNLPPKGEIVPVYPLCAGLTQSLVSKSIRTVLKEAAPPPDPMPEGLRSELRLLDYREALRGIHFPKDHEQLAASRRRLAFDELLPLRLGMLLLKSRRAQETGLRLDRPSDMDRFYGQLPFSLTGAQQRAIGDVLRDMASGPPMNRLVQGDVGSGKTLVAAAAAWHAIQNGYQAALMAPTELLAQQHHRSLSPLMEGLGVGCCLLTGGMPAKAQREALSRIESGEAGLVIGTHSLLEERVRFARLGLIVTDEQHRFGVAQRARLAQKGDRPHLLVMSATPIPRTLSLIIYGDLDVSLIDELPPGRSPVDTFVVGEDKRQRAYEFIRKQLREGRQAYVVCPLVEENEKADLKAATALTERLRQEVFPEYSVGLVHGRMKGRDKDRMMTDFAANQLQVLVSTTVIEVGVDVPNATVMVVENAERFGLSQLHQLRGRVGRGTGKSYCLLFSESRGETARQRLDTMRRTHNGFEIAQKDLELRGPGEFFGSRQHGLPRFRMANLVTDVRILDEAGEAAARLLERDPGLALPKHGSIRALLSEMFSGEDGIVFN